MKLFSKAVQLAAFSFLIAILFTDQASACIGCNAGLKQAIQQAEKEAYQDRIETDSENGTEAPNFSQEFQKEMYAYGTEERDKGRGSSEAVRLYTDAGQKQKTYASNQGDQAQYIKFSGGALSCKIDQSDVRYDDKGYIKASYIVPQHTTKDTDFPEIIRASLYQLAKPLVGESSIMPQAILVAGAGGGLAGLGKELDIIKQGTRSKDPQVKGAGLPYITSGRKVSQKIDQKRQDWKFGDPKKSVQSRKSPQKQLGTGDPDDDPKENDDNGQCGEDGLRKGKCQ